MTAVPENTLLEELAAIGRQSDADIDIARTALLLARLDLPEVECEPYYAHLEDLRAAAVEGASLVVGLRQVMYEANGYRGDSETYDDGDNANLLQVIDRRKGLPVALGILCIHVARAWGSVIDGTAFPSHFLLRLIEGDEFLYLDPFDSLTVMDDAAVQALFVQMHGSAARFDQAYLQPVSDRAVLLRLQNNIKLRAYQAGEIKRALQVAERMVMLAPALGELRLSVAGLLAEAGMIRSAMTTLEAVSNDSGHERLHAEAQKRLLSLRSRLN